MASSCWAREKATFILPTSWAPIATSIITPPTPEIPGLLPELRQGEATSMIELRCSWIGIGGFGAHSFSDNITPPFVTSEGFKDGAKTASGNPRGPRLHRLGNCAGALAACPARIETTGETGRPPEQKFAKSHQDQHCMSSGSPPQRALYPRTMGDPPEGAPPLTKNWALSMHTSRSRLAAS